MSQTVDITPHKSLISKLGRTGYRTEQAVAELVDNAIDARLDGAKEKITVDLDFRSGRIIVSDDGRGMGAEALADAFTIAKDAGKDGLGRFGMGMKSACSSLGEVFEVSTTEAGSDAALTAKYDEKEWLKDDSRGWENFEIRKGRVGKNAHGTTVTVSELRVPLYPNQAPNFRKRFGIRYGPHLEDGRVEIRVNSRACEPAKPDLIDGTRREISIDLPSGKRITGWVGVLEKRSIKGDYGIHLYWRGRLIKAFAKFGIRNHPEVSSVVGRLSLDHMPVNFHKTGFIEEAPEYAEALECFKKDPALVEIIRGCSPSGSRIKIQDVFGDGPARPVESMGMEKAGSLLRGAKEFKAKRGDFGMDVKFSDGRGGIYEAEAIPGGARITVERDSAAFKAFRNPLLLLGWVRIEAELIASGPRDLGAFILERNRRWSKFAEESMRRNADRTACPPSMPSPTPNYSLSEELVELHDGLVEGFGRQFQFTAACTLSRFMRNAYSNIVYTIHTVKGAGDQMYEVLDDKLAAEWERAGGKMGKQMRGAGAKPAALLDPSDKDVYNALGLGHDRVFVVRESSERLAGTWAPPEKAWLDLYREAAKGITLYAGELEWVLDELVSVGLASRAKIKALAVRRKMVADVEPYLEAV